MDYVSASPYRVPISRSRWQLKQQLKKSESAKKTQVILRRNHQCIARRFHLKPELFRRGDKVESTQVADLKCRQRIAPPHSADLWRLSVSALSFSVRQLTYLSLGRHLKKEIKPQEKENNIRRPPRQERRQLPNPSHRGQQIRSKPI